MNKFILKLKAKNLLKREIKEYENEEFYRD